MNLNSISNFSDLSVGDLVQFSLFGSIAVGNIISLDAGKENTNIKVVHISKESDLGFQEKFNLKRATSINVLFKDILYKIVNQEVFVASVEGIFRDEKTFIGYVILIEDSNLDVEEQKRQAYEKLFEYLNNFSDINPIRNDSGITVDWYRNCQQIEIYLEKVILL